MTALSRNARVAGLLYVLASAVGVVRLLYVPKALFVDGNAAVTANNIAAHQSLFSWGIVSSLVAAALWLFVPLALYRLLRGVDESLAVVMVILGSLMQTPLCFVSSVSDAAALILVRGTDFLSVFDKPQRDALAMLCLKLFHHLYLASLIFGGLCLFPFGFLVYQSRFLPRFLGIWLMFGCFGWLAFSFTGLMWPEAEDVVFNVSQLFTLGEVATMLWLVIMGAKEQPLLLAESS